MVFTEGHGRNRNRKKPTGEPFHSITNDDRRRIVLRVIENGEEKTTVCNDEGISRSWFYDLWYNAVGLPSRKGKVNPTPGEALEEAIKEMEFRQKLVELVGEDGITPED